MIERADGRPTAWAGDSGRFKGPDTAERLHGALVAAAGACVLPEARDGLALKAMASGVPLAELARRAGAIDVEAAELRERLAQAERDRAKGARDRARTAAFMAEHGISV
jgi:hypothetical protein